MFVLYFQYVHVPLYFLVHYYSVAFLYIKLSVLAIYVAWQIARRVLV